MRPTTQIYKITLLIDTDRLVRAKIIDHFDFIFLTEFRE